MLGEHEMRDIDERREQIMSHQPKRRSCSSDQVQIICTQVPAVWRCRVCRRGFESRKQELLSVAADLDSNLRCRKGDVAQPADYLSDQGRSGRR